MAKTNQQIIVTEGDFGVEILTQFIDTEKKPIPIEGCSCKVKFEYDGNVISERMGVVIDEPKGIVSVILDKEETQYSGLWTSYWICYDQVNNVTTTENIYYYVQPAIGSVNNPAFTELLNYYNRDEVNGIFKNILEQLNHYTLTEDKVEEYIKIYAQDKLEKDFIRQCILDSIENGIDYAKKEEVETINSQQVKLTNDIKSINSQLDNKANYNTVWSMTNMGQDVKEAMTGGSVAVVGKNTILEENIVDNQVTPIKTSFMEETSKSSNLFNYKTVTLGKYLSASSGGEREGADYLYTDFIEVTRGENITLTKCYNAIITYYSTNKEFVSGESIGNNPNGKTLTITENGYIKVSLRYLNISGVANFDYTCFAVCKGNSAIYEPYGGKIKLKDEYVQDIIDDIEELKKISNSNKYIVVSKKGGDYNNLTEAVLKSNTGDIILLMPGIYENEVVEAWGKTIYVIGVSKTDCIIKNSTGAYHTPPIEASSGLFKNLTIIHEKNSNTTGINGYAIHIEDNDTANKNLVFENCYIESQNNWAIGMGMRGGCYVEFNKCDLVGNDNSHGGLFFHDSDIDEYLGKQTIRCIDTNIFSIGTNTSDLKIQSQCKDGSIVNVEFIRTNVRNITNGKQTKVFLNDNNGVYTSVANIKDLTNFNLSKISYGNSMEILNY